MSLALLLLVASASAQSLESLHHAAARAFDGLRVEKSAQAAPVPARTEPAPLALSDLARLLAQDPTALDELFDLIVKKAGPLGQAYDTPARRAELKEALRTADPAVLDRFPTLSPAGLAAVAEAYASRQGPVAEPARPAELKLALTGQPADPPKDAFLKPLGHGLLYGDETRLGAAAAWGDTKAVAESLNQLSYFGRVVDAGRPYASITAWLNALLAEGHTLELRDRRMHANFGDLMLETPAGRRDVATPTLMDTGIVLLSGRRLIVPAPHSEFHLIVRGPRVKADLSWFFGLDGRAAFRALDTEDQGWVGGRDVAAWSGAAVVPLMERAGWVSRELSAKAKALNLPAGGYGPLGDCNDAQALVTGVAPLGMLRDPKLFAGTGAFDAASRALPYDRAAPPSARRVWESRAFENVDEVPLPEVRAALLELKTQLGVK